MCWWGGGLCMVVLHSFEDSPGETTAFRVGGYRIKAKFSLWTCLKFDFYNENYVLPGSYVNLRGRRVSGLYLDHSRVLNKTL